MPGAITFSAYAARKVMTSTHLALRPRVALEPSENTVPSWLTVMPKNRSGPNRLTRLASTSRPA
ncbi:MAG: hypothetical protein WKF72_11830 [Nocardioidaceae bacterium]